ncbi:MAG: branched-chain amino acid ABC transporter permease [Actinomycetia bacterium]|nr:branched-chain amino acid ABC transporter permease [Actinomycetes bacterium]
MLFFMPFLNFKQYYMHTFIMICIYILLTQGLNLISGFTGQLSLGHAAFYGIGAYASALLSLRLGVPVWLSIPVAAVFAGVFGIALGFPCLRLKGPYLVIATLGFGEIMRLIFLNWVKLTRGPMGITGIMSPETADLGFIKFSFDTKKTYFLLVLLIVILTVYFLNKLINSKTGRAMIAIREDQIAAELMGVNITYYKLFALVLSAFLAGLAGALYAHYIRYISPDSFVISESINILVMVVIGGMGTIIGPIIGSIFIELLLEYMRILQEYRLIIYGLLLFFTIIYLPGGLAGLARSVFEKILLLIDRKRKIKCTE